MIARAVSLAVLALVALGGAQAAERTYVHAGKLLADPATGKVASNQTLVVEDGRVVEIRDGFVGEGRVVDLRQRFVLPGLIDSHVHLTNQPGPDSRYNKFARSDSAAAIQGAANAKKTLEAGFTTVADLGAPSDAIVALRNGIASGQVSGPRIVASAGMISPHGGHGDVNGVKSDLIPHMRSGGVCSGPDDCRRAVRERIQAGADIIKITATGGVTSDANTGLGQHFSKGELEAIVETAHFMNRTVTGHAHGTDGINSFLAAGGDSVEHGTFQNDESVRLFVATKAWFIPTLLVGDYVARQAEKADSGMTDNQRAKSRSSGHDMKAIVRRAHKAGVRIAFGTDTGVSPHGENAREFALLVQSGLTPLEAIRTATVNAAEHFRLDKEIGRLTPGFAADLMAVDGDPLTDVTVLERPVYVMKAGQAALEH